MQYVSLHACLSGYLCTYLAVPPRPTGIIQTVNDVFRLEKIAEISKNKNSVDQMAEIECNPSYQIERVEVSKTGLGSRPDNRTKSSNDHSSKLSTICIPKNHDTIEQD